MIQLLLMFQTALAKSASEPDSEKVAQAVSGQKNIRTAVRIFAWSLTRDSNPRYRLESRNTARWVSNGNRTVFR